MSVQEPVKRRVYLERCFMTNIIQYMKSGDIFKVMSTCKKFSDLPLSLRRNYEPIEVKTYTIYPTRIVPYKIYELINTLDVYSYRDLFKIYFDIIDKSFELPVPNYFEVLGFIRLTDKFEYLKIRKLVDEWNTLKSDTKMTPDLRSRAIDNKEEEITEYLIECKSIVDQNGVNLNMILNEYKKYFPRLTAITIQLPRIKLFSEKKIYLFIKRFVDWYSKKLIWNTKSYIHSILNEDITNEDNEKELQLINELINEGDDMNIKNMIPPEYNAKDAIEDDRKEELNLFDNSDEDNENEDMIEEIDLDQIDQLLAQQDEQEDHQLFVGNLLNQLNIVDFDVINRNHIFRNVDIQDDNQNDIFDEIVLGRIRNHENTITIPNTWKIIPNEIFKDHYIMNIQFQNTIKCLGNSSFEQCRYLADLTIPASIQYIGIACFKGCISLTTIKFEHPGNLKWLGDKCFMNCINLLELTLPNGLKEVGTSCFEGCSSLKTITLPKSLLKLGKWMFKGCSNLFKFENPYQIPWRKSDDPFDQTPYKLISLLAKFKK